MYQRKHTWIEGGPPWVKAQAPVLSMRKGMGEVDVETGLQYTPGLNYGQTLDYGSGEMGAPPLPAAAAGSPCFSVAFPWIGTQAAGVCKPVVNVSSTIGIGITVIAIALAVYKVVSR